MTAQRDKDPGASDDDTGELGTLYRQLPRLEPPRRLDRDVIGAAARAIRGARPRRQRRIVGVSSATGIALAAAMAWQMGHDAAQHDIRDRAPRAPRVVAIEPITQSVHAPAPVRREPESTHRDAATDALDQAMPNRVHTPAPPVPGVPTADIWLAHIRLLLRQGQRERATDSLRRFQRVYPHAHLPIELKTLLD